MAVLPLAVIATRTSRAAAVALKARMRRGLILRMAAEPMNRPTMAPPQYQGLAARALVELDAAPLVPAGGLVIAQIHPRERGDLDGLQLQRLNRIDERRYGSTLLVFYESAED